MKAYHADRGNTVTASTADIEKAIVEATDYLDTRWTFVGEVPTQTQTTAWPRLDAEDINDNLRTGIPHEVQEACSEYALIALSGDLNPNPERDTTGAQVQSKVDVVGPIREERTFSGGATFTLPKYPVADRKLTASGLALTGRTMRRA
jgi:hypothetical protein